MHYDMYSIMYYVLNVYGILFVHELLYMYSLIKAHKHDVNSCNIEMSAKDKMDDNGNYIIEGMCESIWFNFDCLH